MKSYAWYLATSILRQVADIFDIVNGMKEKKKNKKRKSVNPQPRRN